MKEIRAPIADDEVLARARVRELLEEDSRFRVVLWCGPRLRCGPSGSGSAPQLLILDVQMPGLDGFGALAPLDPAELPTTGAICSKPSMKTVSQSR